MRETALNLLPATKAHLETPGSVTSKLKNYFNLAGIGSYPIIGDDGIATGLGNMGVGLVNGPGMSNLDLALTKRIPMRLFSRESNWEFRAEAFNAFNTPHFASRHEHRGWLRLRGRLINNCQSTSPSARFEI
jgi:hypothetical protein